MLKLEDLVNRALQSDADKYKVAVIAIDEEGGTILAEKKDVKTISRFLDMDGNSAEERIDQESMLIYEHCKILHDKMLHEVYEVVEPYEVVEKVFLSNIELMDKAAEKILQMYGFKRKKGDKGKKDNEEENVETDAVDMVKN